MDIKIFCDNKKFWQKVKPLFSEKSNLKRNITIVENDTVISDKTEVAEKLNSFFIEVVENLEIEFFFPIMMMIMKVLYHRMLKGRLILSSRNMIHIPVF